MQRQFDDASASTAEQLEPRDTAVPTSGAQATETTTQAVRCVACGSLALSMIGDRAGAPGHFNVCCDRCALLQVAPSLVEGPASTDADVTVDKETALARAERISLGANVKMGDAVLGFGAYGAQLLDDFDDLFGIDGHVVATARLDTPVPRGNVSVFTGDVTALNPGLRFDTVLALHVAHRWTDPLAALLRLRALMKPSALMLIEVPNVLPGGEFEFRAFLSPGLTSSFSHNTIRLILQRAGFNVEVLRDEDTLLLSCRPNAAAGPLPVPFRPDMLRLPEQDGGWLVARLATYVAAEQAKTEVLGGNVDPESARVLMRLLKEPAFHSHLIDIIVEVIQGYAQAGALTAARMLTNAAAESAPEEYRAEFRKLSEALA